jgi:DNA-binding NarL/FixJ family response regulator
MAGGVRGGRDHPGLAARTPAATSGKPAATRNNSGVHGPGRRHARAGHHWTITKTQRSSQLSRARAGREHAAGRIGPGCLAALLRACGRAGAVPPPGRAAPPGLAEPLTDRELEMLRLIAAGRSNQGIAHDLVVALDTVKSM